MHLQLMSLAFVAILNRQIAHASGGYERNFLAYCSTGGLQKIYRMSQEEWTKLRGSVPYVELYRYNPKHIYPKLNGYGDNDHRKVWASGVSTYCKPSVTPYSSTAHARQRETNR